MGEKWILAWLVVNSIAVTILVMFIVFEGMYDKHRVESMTILLHQRISDLVETTDKQGGELVDLRLKYDPHKRVEALEKWQRTFCSSPKIEACALLGKIEK